MNRPTRIACAAGPLAALLAAVACATTPAGPPPFDPVEAEEGYEGTILSAAFPPIPITSVTVEGQAGTIEAAGPGGPLTVEFTVTDDVIQGMWSMGLEGGDFTATKTG